MILPGTKVIRYARLLAWLNHEYYYEEVYFKFLPRYKGIRQSVLPANIYLKKCHGTCKYQIKMVAVTTTRLLLSTLKGDS